MPPTHCSLPHPVHIHCNNLGVAGNVGMTLDSMRAVEGRRAHFTHLQFHSYAGERGQVVGVRAPGKSPSTSPLTPRSAAMSVR